jgi:hypothetical protein
MRRMIALYESVHPVNPETGEPIDPYTAVREYPELESLLALCERADTGWVFKTGRDTTTGEIDAVQGMRKGPTYLDVIRITSETRAIVARSWLVGPRAGDFILKKEGHPADVIPLLLSLPEPEV